MGLFQEKHPIETEVFSTTGSAQTFSSS